LIYLRKARTAGDKTRRASYNRLYK